MSTEVENKVQDDANEKVDMMQDINTTEAGDFTEDCDFKNENHPDFVHESLNSGIGEVPKPIDVPEKAVPTEKQEILNILKDITLDKNNEDNIACEEKEKEQSHMNLEESNIANNGIEKVNGDVEVCESSRNMTSLEDRDLEETGYTTNLSENQDILSNGDFVDNNQSLETEDEKILEEFIKKKAPEIIEECIEKKAPEVIEDCLEEKAPEVIEDCIEKKAPEVIEGCLEKKAPEVIEDCIEKKAPEVIEDCSIEKKAPEVIEDCSIEKKAPEVIEDCSIEKKAPEVIEDCIEKKAPEVIEDCIEKKAPEVIAKVIEKKAPEVIEKDIEEKAPEVMDVLGSGKIKKKILREGEGQETRPASGQEVIMHIIGRLEDGTVFEDLPHQSFIVGDGDVVAALDLCAALMELGEVAEITTHPDFAYGDIGREPNVPANSYVVYEVELLKTNEIPNYAAMLIMDRLSVAETKRERGNYLYGRSDWAGAIKSYSKAIKVIDDEGQSHSESVEDLQKVVDCRLKCYNNLSACQLKIEAYDAALLSSDSVLRIQPENVKALYRKSKAMIGKGDEESAILYLRKCIKIEPQNKRIHAELSQLTKRQKQQDEKQKAVYSRMLGTEMSNEKAKKKENSKSLAWLMTGAAASVGLAAIIVSLYRGYGAMH